MSKVVHSCPDCGIELSSDARACRECGLRIDSGSVPISPIVQDEFDSWRYERGGQEAWGLSRLTAWAATKCPVR